MAGSALVRVNVTHDYGVQKFEQDLKKAVLAAGIDAKHTVFLLKDAQVCSMVWDLPFVGSSLGPPKCSLHLSLFSSPLTFVVAGSQILEEAMLEDINCLLGSGEVPNLFTPDEEADIVVRVRDAVRATGNPDTQVGVLCTH